MTSQYLSYHPFVFANDLCLAAQPKRLRTIEIRKPNVFVKPLREYHLKTLTMQTKPKHMRVLSSICFSSSNEIIDLVGKSYKVSLLKRFQNEKSP